MAQTEIHLPQHAFPHKRPVPTYQEHRQPKRARLEYILCDTGSVFSLPIASLGQDPIPPNPHPQPQDTLVPSNRADAPTKRDTPLSPTQPQNLYHPTPVQLPPAPQPAPAINTQPLDKFTKSRAVGQSHRDNEKEHIRALREDVEKCRDENILLFALFSASYKLEHCKPLPHRLLNDVRLRLPDDRAEDFNLLTDEEAESRGLYKLSAQSAKLLQQRYISPALAVVLLEFICYRRNLVPVPTDTNEQGHRRRKRRSGFRVALSSATAEEVVDFAVKLFAQEDRGDEDFQQYVDRRLGSLAVLVDTWSEVEANNDPPKIIEPETEVVPFHPTSPTRPEAAEFGSPRRRGEGAKRCSRCNMVKFTGSGHGRSKCDDGYSISSRVPYRPPASAGSEHTSADGPTEHSVASN